jgi:GNAT superfamily N-acetyltransferase
VEFRTLRPGERPALLELLDGWELADGWRGRDFFRRYFEDDPTFSEENVWAAFHEGRPVSCVQIFPRRLRIGAAVVPTGGIGSVYTAPGRRRSGLAGALLARAVEDMSRRGMDLSLLFTTRTSWYEKLGWASWNLERSILHGPVRPQEHTRSQRSPQPGERAVDAFESRRDLPGVRALYERYSGLLDGTAVRDDALWAASLRNAGNPSEDFLVAREGGRVAAYARATVLYGVRTVLEFGRSENGRDALADVLAQVSEGRALAPLLAFEEGLEAALGDRAIRLETVRDPTVMLRCLRPSALADRLGTSTAPDEAPEALLRRVLPPERFCFWPADRF